MVIFCNKGFFPFPPVADPIDTQTITARFRLPTLVDCLDLPVDGCASLWNNSLCKTDYPYYQFVPADGTIDLLFNFPDAVNNYDAPAFPVVSTDVAFPYFIKIDLIDCNCEAVANNGEFLQSWWIGANEDRTAFWQALRINVASINVDKFGFAITVQTGGGNSQTFFTEQYEKPCADRLCREQVYFRGLHRNGVDCAGLWRGTVAPPSVFGIYFEPFDELYLDGNVTVDGFTVDKQSENNTPVSVRNEANITAKLYHIPPYIAERLNNILTAPYVGVNDTETEFVGDLEKNNEFSNMWLPVLEFTKLECDKNYKC
jgi:hypothetical protein